MGQHLSRIANCCNGTVTEEYEVIQADQRRQVQSPRPDSMVMDQSSVQSQNIASPAFGGGAQGGSSTTTMDLQKMAGIAA